MSSSANRVKSRTRAWTAYRSPEEVSWTNSRLQATQKCWVIDFPLISSDQTVAEGLKAADHLLGLLTRRVGGRVSPDIARYTEHDVSHPLPIDALVARAREASERDRRLAVPRCWSRGDSNRRSHPTKSLVCRRIGTDLWQPQTSRCEVRPPAVRSDSLV